MDHGRVGTVPANPRHTVRAPSLSRPTGYTCLTAFCPCWLHSRTPSRSKSCARRTIRFAPKTLRRCPNTKRGPWLAFATTSFAGEFLLRIPRVYAEPVRNVINMGSSKGSLDHTETSMAFVWKVGGEAQPQATVLLRDREQTSCFPPLYKRCFALRLINSDNMTWIDCDCPATAHLTSCPFSGALCAAV